LIRRIHELVGSDEKWSENAEYDVDLAERDIRNVVRELSDN